MGIALILTYLAKKKMTLSQLRATYPDYVITKNRIDLKPEMNIDAILDAVKKHYSNEKITDIDGVKIDFPTAWVHLRKSNTEPIIRVYSEASTEEEANKLAEDVINQVMSLI